MFPMMRNPIFTLARAFLLNVPAAAELAAVKQNVG
jgi:hypothetical protein